MNIQQLVDYCTAKKIPFTTEIALRAKDDYLLTKGKITLDIPYFGNCADGSKWERKSAPRDENGDIDYENMPTFLILDTQQG